MKISISAGNTEAVTSLKARITKLNAKVISIANAAQSSSAVALRIRKQLNTTSKARFDADALSTFDADLDELEKIWFDIDAHAIEKAVREVE